jgi:hypothetical protein
MTDVHANSKDQGLCTFTNRNPLVLQLCFQLQTKLKTTHIVAIYFLQLLTSDIDKYKSRVKLQLKVYTTWQHHNNSHYVPLLANLVENCSTNIVKGCCQLHLTNGWTSFAN